MIQFHLSIDSARLERELERLYRDQIPFAMSRALNATALHLRDEMRARVGSEFTIRRPAVQRLSFQIPRGGFATKRKPEAVVELAPKFGFLAKHEKGGTITASDPRFPFALPTEHARTGRKGSVPLALYPKNLRLEPRRTPSDILGARTRVGRKGTVQFVGKRRTFLLHPEFHDTQTHGIFQRTGPRRSSIRLLWFMRRSVTLRPRLGFEETARRLVPEVWPREFERAWRQAIATAR